jgi:TonB family protein
MGNKKKQGTPKWIGFAAAGIAVILIAGGVFLLRTLLQDSSKQRQRRIQMVQLVKPPPPPKIKEKPPEPKIEKKKEIIEPEPEKPPEEAPEEAQDEGPQDDQLGLDADGTAGSDGFGLKAKKGGRALIGGGGTLMRRYAWYVQLVQDEIRKEVKRRLEENGGIPDGKLQTLVRIELDREGELLGFRIVGSSGNPAMDEAVQAALKSIRRFREPLPGGMPRAAMKLKIASKG